MFVEANPLKLQHYENEFVTTWRAELEYCVTVVLVMASHQAPQQKTVSWPSQILWKGRCHTCSCRETYHCCVTKFNGFYGYFFNCLVGCFNMIVWMPAFLSVLYACVLYFCICTSSAQLSMFHMERHSRNMHIIIIITIMIIIMNIITIIIISTANEEPSETRRESRTLTILLPDSRCLKILSGRDHNKSLQAPPKIYTFQ